jgi:hypothetical protein
MSSRLDVAAFKSLSPKKVIDQKGFSMNFNVSYKLFPAIRSGARARCEAKAIGAIAEASAGALPRVGAAIRHQGREDAINLRAAEHYVDAFGKPAKANNPTMVPAKLGGTRGLIASVLQAVKTREKKVRK